MRRALDAVYLASGYLAAFNLVAIGVLVLASIISRWLGIYVAGLNEFSGYAMAASSFFALAYAFGRGAHIRVNLLLGHLAGRGRWLGELWCLLVGSGLTLYLAYFCIRMVLVSADFGELSEGPDATPLWIPQLPMALGASLFALALVDRLLTTLLTGEVIADPETMSSPIID